MELYSTFQIKDHYHWVEEATKPVVKAEVKPIVKPARSIRVIESDGTTSYYDAPTPCRPVVMPGGIWV